MFEEIEYFDEWSNEEILSHLQHLYGEKMVDHYQDKVRLGISVIEEENRAVLEEVDISDLRMLQTCQCVLGQYYGSFSKGLIKLNIDPNRTNDYALDGIEEVDVEELLDGLWTAEIRNWRERGVSYA